MVVYALRSMYEKEFLSEFGIRALLRHHLEHSCRFSTAGADFTVAYLPGESDSSMFGGNSNWRGLV